MMSHYVNTSRTAEVFLLMAAFVSLWPGTAKGQTAQTAPSQTTASFEVATVKPSAIGMSSPAARIVLTDSSFITVGEPVTKLIQIAYDLSFGSTDQIVGGPKWMRDDPFDVEGKLPVVSIGAVKTTPDVGAMVRTLLAERFKLKVHRETREMHVYALTVAKKGLKMKITSDVNGGDCCFLRRQSVGEFDGHGTSTATLTNMLASQPEIGGKLVLDKTERNAPTDRFDFVLKWTPEMGAAAAPADSSGPSLFTALQEELGLRLESTKAPVDVIVIDSVDSPTEN
jgi:uncharacterized protein (TIGR03435 family)